MGEIFVPNVAELRKKKGLTQRQLADLVDADITTIRNWERGRGGIETFVRIAKLCKALECEPQDLFRIERIE